MDILDKMLQSRYGNLVPKNRRLLKEATMKWLLNADDENGKEFNASALNRLMRKVLGKDSKPREYSMDLTYSKHSGYLLGHLKPWFWWGVKHKLSAVELRRKATAFGVQENDGFLVTLIPALTRACGGLMRYDAHTIKELDEKMNTALAALRGYADNYCRRKLAFVAKGYWKWSHEDLRAELTTLAMRDVRTQYPKIDDDLHWLNIMKGSVNRRGLNIITKTTGKDSQGLVPIGDYRNGVFGTKTMPLPEGDSEATAVDRNTMSLDREIFSRVFLEQYKGDERTVLTLFAGLPHKGFSDWLGEKSEDFYERCMMGKKQKEFLDTVREYTNMGEEQMGELMQRIATGGKT